MFARLRFVSLGVAGTLWLAWLRQGSAVSASVGVYTHRAVVRKKIALCPIACKVRLCCGYFTVPICSWASYFAFPSYSPRITGFKKLVFFLPVFFMENIFFRWCSESCKMEQHEGGAFEGYILIFFSMVFEFVGNDTPLRRLRGD